jgi:hypothetical protein
MIRSKDEAGANMAEKPTCVYTAEGEIEAQQIRSFLEANDIPCIFHGEALRKTHGLTLDGLGLVEIHVPEELVEQAKELIARANAGELALEAEDDESPS